MLDLDAYRAAHRAWGFSFRGRVFRGRHVSAMDVLRFKELLEAARRERQMVAAHKWLLRRAFPWRVDYLLRGDPVRVLLNLSPPERQEALDSFFGSLEVRPPTSLQPLATNGTHSSNRTSRQPA